MNLWKKIAILFWLSWFLIPLSSGWTVHSKTGGDEVLSLSIMRPGLDVFLGWQQEAEKAPRSHIDDDIRQRLLDSRRRNYGTSMSLLTNLDYNAAERQQGNCGNCWNWAGQGVMAIALNVQDGIKTRLSTQFLNSCKTDSFACCGGYLIAFADWYREKGYAIPWSNAGAAFTDATTTCQDGASAVSCAEVSTYPSYPVSSITQSTIDTVYTGQATAIANIKNVLNQNKAVWFGFFLPDDSQWNRFFNFWSGAVASEYDLWDPDPSCGYQWNESQGGGHAVLLVGYNDDDPSFDNHYWIFLNSWGAASGKRLNGLFRMKMDIDYDCYFPSSRGNVYAMTWQTLDIAFDIGQSCNYAIYPDSADFGAGGGSGALQVTVDAGCSWTAVPGAAWISISSGGSGSGSGTLYYTVAANAGGSRTGSVVVENRTLTIQQGGSQLETNLLENPGFENGDNMIWDNNGYVIFLAPCFTYGGIECAEEGNYLAWLGGYNGAYDYLEQITSIPSDATSASLSFAYAIETEEWPIYANDSMGVYILRTRDWWGRTVAIYSNLDANFDWERSPEYDVSDFLGEDVLVGFDCATNYNFITNFFIDDVVLSATVAPDSEINVKGNGIDIADGDSIPSTFDHTDFGVAAVDSGKTTHAFVIQNTGTTELRLTGTPKVVIGGLHPEDFTLVAEPASPVSTGGQTSFQIRFDPGQVGLRQAEAIISNDDPDENPYNFAIRGEGVEFFVWLGYSEFWNNAGNWTDGMVPDQTVLVLIPATPSGGYFPKINTWPEAKASRLVMEGGRITVESGKLAIGGP